jgi:hypothetical protein
MNQADFADRDMRDHFSLGSALEDRFAWSVMSSSPSPDRKIFENACEKWDKWEHEQRHTIASHPYRSPNRHRSHATVNSSSRGYSANINVAEDSEHSGNRASQDYAGTPIFSHSRPQQDSRSKRASISSVSAMLPPTRRLSRAMRVFVAWKA